MADEEGLMADTSLVEEPTWTVEEIVDAVNSMLPVCRVRQCCMATRLMIATFCYSLAHGRLTLNGETISEVYKMVGNVSNKDYAFNGGAEKRGHWWVRLNKHDGSHANFDLTAKQFYKSMPEKYMGDPKGIPLFAVTEGIADGGDEECGEFFEDPAEYADTRVVLRAFGRIHGAAARLREAYKRLAMR